MLIPRDKMMDVYRQGDDPGLSIDMSSKRGPVSTGRSLSLHQRTPPDDVKGGGAASSHERSAQVSALYEQLKSLDPRADYFQAIRIFLKILAHEHHEPSIQRQELPEQFTMAKVDHDNLWEYINSYSVEHRNALFALVDEVFANIPNSATAIADFKRTYDEHHKK